MPESSQCEQIKNKLDNLIKEKDKLEILLQTIAQLTIKMISYDNPDRQLLLETFERNRDRLEVIKLEITQISRELELCNNYKGCRNLGGSNCKNLFNIKYTWTYEDYSSQKTQLENRIAEINQEIQDLQRCINRGGLISVNEGGKNQWGNGENFTIKLRIYNQTNADTLYPPDWVSGPNTLTGTWGPNISLRPGFYWAPMAGDGLVWYANGTKPRGDDPRSNWEIKNLQDFIYGDDICLNDNERRAVVELLSTVDSVIYDWSIKLPGGQSDYPNLSQIGKQKLKEIWDKHKQRLETILEEKKQNLETLIKQLDCINKKLEITQDSSLLPNIEEKIRTKIELISEELIKNNPIIYDREVVISAPLLNDEENNQTIALNNTSCIEVSDSQASINIPKALAQIDIGCSDPTQPLAFQPKFTFPATISSQITIYDSWFLNFKSSMNKLVSSVKEYPTDIVTNDECLKYIGVSINLIIELDSNPISFSICVGAPK